MSGSVEGAVSTALGLENWTAMLEKNNNLLRKVLDNQASVITSLVNDPVQAPKLAEHGSVGTRLHVTA